MKNDMEQLIILAQKVNRNNRRGIVDVELIKELEALYHRLKVQYVMQYHGITNSQ